MLVSQPAVSRHISELETAFGTALFVRSASGVELTAAGRLLLAHADALLQAVGRMEADMQDIVGSEQGRLRIGASTTIATYVLPSVLAAFMERFKGVDLSREFASVTRQGEFSGLNEKFHNFAASMKKSV